MLVNTLMYQKLNIVAFFQNQKVVDRLDGANAPSLTKKVQHHANVITPAVTSANQQETKKVHLF